MSGLFQLLGLGARSLSTAQLAQATVGNNAANAATPGFSRRRVTLVEGPTVRLGDGVFGTGVSAGEVARLRDALVDAQWRADSQELAYAKTQTQLLAQVEAMLGPADQAALGTTLNELFAAFGDLATWPEDLAVRRSLLGRGQAFTDAVRRTRDRLERLEADAFTALDDRVREVNQVSARLAEINGQQVAGAADPSLADEQDRLVDRLAELIGVRATRRGDGSVGVVLDGTGIQLVGGPRAATLALSGLPASGAVSLTVDGLSLAQTRGEIGGVLAMRNSSTAGLPAVVANLDAFASGVIAAVNRVHASGAGRTLGQSVTGAVSVGDPAATLAGAGLWLTPTTGNLTLGVFDASGALVSSSTVAVDPATMSLNDLAAALDALPNISAAVSGGKLTVSATSAANRIAFGDDASDVLAALGLNGFFTGTDAASIAVSADLTADPSRVAAGKADFAAGLISPGDGSTARDLQALASSRVLNGNTETPAEFLASLGASVGVTSRAAAARVEIQEVLVQAAAVQRQSVAGVNLDEELADMVQFQHAYEASARYIRTVDEMIRALLEIL